MGVPSPRTAIQRGRDIDQRLDLLERAMVTTSLPPRLSSAGEQVQDWNDIILPGFYWSDSAALNPPVSGQPWAGVTLRLGEGGTVIQTVYQGSLGVPADAAKPGMRRYQVAGAWTPWTAISGGGGTGGSVSWLDILDRPTTFPPSTHEHSAADVTSGRFSVARIPHVTNNSTNGRAYFGTDQTNPVSSTSNFLALSPDSDTGTPPVRFMRNNATTIFAIESDGEITGNAKLAASRLLGIVPDANLPERNLGTINADALPNTFPVGVTFGQAGTGFPASIGTVMNVRHSDFRQFQHFYDRSTNTRFWVRASNGGTAWQNFREVLTDASPVTVAESPSFDADFRMNPAVWSGAAGQRLTIPTHVSPAGGQTTHPSVLYFPEGWNGYRYWMGHTPYPGSNDDFEDPNLAVSNDGITWVAAPGVTQPLDDADGTPEYNSDIDLAMGPNNTMYLFWRFYDSSLASNQEKLYVRTSTDGVNWTAKTLVWQYTQTTLRPLSPSFLYEDGRWTAWAVDVSNAAAPRLIRMQTSGASPTGWSAATTCTVSGIPSGKAPWHLDVIRVGGQLVGLLNATNTGDGGVDGILLMMTSTNGTAWTAGGASAIPVSLSGEYNQLYRGTLIPEFNDGVLGVRIWYSAYLRNPDNSTVWNIYRTWVGPTSAATRRSASGFYAYTTLVAPSGGATLTISFPPGSFTSAPTAVLISVGGSSRLNAAVTAITATNFQVRLDNFTTGNAAPFGVHWQAIE